jgi:tRNA(Arg) A34 adenosine deaminase TadA
MEQHEHWMRQALEMARDNPRSPFGTVIVHVPSQRILAGGLNHTKDSPIWHGEMDALSQLDRETPFAECALYTTGEPCVMCQGAIMFAGIPLVVYGTHIPTLEALGIGQVKLRAAEIAAKGWAPVTVIGGVLEGECDAMFRAAMRLRAVEAPGVVAQDVPGRLVGLPGA